jgi:hypothetical protein
VCKQFRRDSSRLEPFGGFLTKVVANTQPHSQPQINYNCS